jgi:hypothetical protein
MHSVAYPLLDKDLNKNSNFARSVIDGEYILHRCPENDGTFTSEDEGAKFTMLPWQWNWFAFHWPWDEGGWPWWGWILFFILCCCGCGCCVLFCGILGLCNMAKNSITGSAKNNQTAPHDQDSGSSSSGSDSESDRKHKRQSKQSLLQNQKFASLSHGTGHQATQAFHSGSAGGIQAHPGNAKLHG